jgi:Flp pilus assembly protein TadG
MERQQRSSREKGVSLILGTASLIFIIPMLGLMIDVGVLYAAKAKLQAAVDGASLAAARALNLGQTTASQADSAKQNAVNWFYANFPVGAWGTTGTVMSTSSVNVFDDASNPHLRNVTVTATTTVPTYFMKWFNVGSTTITSSGNASRRDVVVMMVLDRSGSMCDPIGLGPCDSSDTTTACAAMINAAKLFTGTFAAGRDRIGLVSFSDNVYVHSQPTTNFQSVLGYSNNSGSGTGEIDSIKCNGFTGTAEGVSIAYNMLYQVNLPGALNLIFLETDGLPNMLTLNFWDSTNSVAGIKSTSNCKDNSNLKISAGGFRTTASLPSWTAGRSLTSSPFSSATSYLPDIPAGIVGGVTSYNPYMLLKYFTTSKTSNFNTLGFITSTTAVPGCSFTSTLKPDADIAWWPSTDVFGNYLNPPYTYQSVSTDAQGHITSPTNWTNFQSAVLNATDYSAYQARTNPTLPAYFLAIGLGGNGSDPPDSVLLQRMANDPNGDMFNTPATYDPCADETGCVTYSNQPQGTFIYSPDQSQLAQAFLKISSQILRLSK